MEMLRKIKRKARPLARFGCFSIGTVYALVGVLALLALSGTLTGAADEDRMVHVLMGIPGGPVLIWGIVSGLAGYVLWRIAEALADPYEFGNDWSGIARRAGIAVSGLVYGFLAYSAGRIARAGADGGSGPHSEEQQQLLIAQVLEWPAGGWLVGGTGVILAAFGAGQVLYLARRAYLMEVNLDALSRRWRRVLDVLAWAGYSARTVILGVLGYFLIRAAATVDPEQVGDTDTAFDFIGGGMAGDTAFFLVALGTIAYGAYMFLCGTYYKFQRHPGRDGTAG